MIDIPLSVSELMLQARAKKMKPDCYVGRTAVEVVRKRELLLK